MFHVRTVATGVAGSPWYTNMYFRSSDGRAAADAAIAVRTFWDTLSTVINDQVTFQVSDLIPTVDAANGDITAYAAVTTAPVDGGSAVLPLPFSNQGLIRLNTAGVVRNRRVQGRIFVPGLIAAQEVNGTPNPGTLAAMQTAVDGLLDDSANVQLVVWSRPIELDDPLPGVLPGSEHNVTGATARDIYAVMRSRRD